jgi:hypothetical protein
LDFIRTCQNDSLEDIIKEYGNEFSREDLQLMKVHFLSEMAY